MFGYSFYVKVTGKNDNQGAGCRKVACSLIEVGVKSWMSLSKTDTIVV